MSTKKSKQTKNSQRVVEAYFFKKARDKSFLVQHVISKLAVTALPTEPIQIIEDYPSAAASDHNLDVHKRVPVSVKSFIFNKNDLVAFDRAKSINDQQVLAGQLFLQALQTPLVNRLDQFVNQCGGRCEPDLETLLAGRQVVSGSWWKFEGGVISG